MAEENRKPTTEKLAEALIAAHAPTEMVERARSGHYDDYISDVADNISALVRDARQHGLEDIATRAIDGEFDGQNWEADQWGKSQEGRETFKQFSHLLPRKKKRQ